MVWSVSFGKGTKEKKKQQHKWRIYASSDAKTQLSERFSNVQTSFYVNTATAKTTNAHMESASMAAISSLR